MSESTNSNDGAAKPAREVSFRHSEKFVPILRHLNASLLVSTYAAGKVVSVGAGPEGLTLDFSNFKKAMGMAIGQGSLAVGGPDCVWFLRDGGSIAAAVEPTETYEKVFLVRESFVTGNIHVHEMDFDADGVLWVTNTLFSCLCTLDERFNFVPRWRPGFISELAAEDRCHLNGMCFDEQGRPAYVTALGESDSFRGWRENKSTGGLVIDIASGETVAKGFCMPHSPRVHPAHPGKLFVLDSGHGRLSVIDRASGNVDVVDTYPGYGRGMAITEQFAFVAMSKARETSVFGGVPICQDRAAMRCGIVVIDLTLGRSVAFLEFESGVEELFDVKVIAGSKRTGIVGPFVADDQRSPVWVIPPEGTVPEGTAASSRFGGIRRRGS